MALPRPISSLGAATRGIWAIFKRTLGLSRQARIPLAPTAILTLLMVAAIFAPWLAPHEPTKGSIYDSHAPPFWVEGGSSEFPLGTDFQGRDILSRIIHGARVSLLVSVLTILVAGGVGSSLGIVAGYRGGVTDAVIMRATDIFFAVPTILLALVFAITLGPSLQNVVIVIVISLWARFSRQIRGEVLSLRERDFVALAHVAGASDLRIMIKHILPNIANTIVVLATWQVGLVILTESSLSFLGVGVPPPAPTWGLMISDGRRWISEAWWVSALPGAAILLTIMAFNLFGDWLRDYLDPRLRQVL